MSTEPIGLILYQLTVFRPPPGWLLTKLAWLMAGYLRPIGNCESEHQGLVAPVSHARHSVQDLPLLVGLI